MGDAAGHARQRLQPLRLVERVLGPLALLAFVGVLLFRALERQPLLQLTLGELAVYLYLVCQLLDDVELQRRHDQAEGHEDDRVAEPDARQPRIPHVDRERRHQLEGHHRPCQQMHTDGRRESGGRAAPPEEQRRGEHRDDVDRRVARGEAPACGEDEPAEGQEREQRHRRPS